MSSRAEPEGSTLSKFKEKKNLNVDETFWGYLKKD